MRSDCTVRGAQQQACQRARERARGERTSERASERASDQAEAYVSLAGTKRCESGIVKNVTGPATRGRRAARDTQHSAPSCALIVHLHQRTTGTRHRGRRLRPRATRWLARAAPVSRAIYVFECEKMCWPKGNPACWRRACCARASRRPAGAGAGRPSRVRAASRVAPAASDARSRPAPRHSAHRREQGENAWLSIR